MKLTPKISTFCPGCRNKKLEIPTSPNIILKPIENSTKKITIFGKNKNKKNKGGLF